jgi:hypothetical protein
MFTTIGLTIVGVLGGSKYLAAQKEGSLRRRLWAVVFGPGPFRPKQ